MKWMLIFGTVVMFKLTAPMAFDQTSKVIPCDQIDASGTCTPTDTPPAE
ncbi:MAG: hypothetical protein JWQ35_2001 [Bacteriovoracaceae bacterium]|nr:hypothetical protein [Bacteriovoracaceae bacterium]